jgi:hypothetical protein
VIDAEQSLQAQSASSPHKWIGALAALTLRRVAARSIQSFLK